MDGNKENVRVHGEAGGREEVRRNDTDERTWEEEGEDWSESEQGGGRDARGDPRVR